MRHPAHKNPIGFLVTIISVAIVGSTLSLLVFWYLFKMVFPEWGHAVDTQLPQTIFNLRTPLLTNIMFLISLFGADFTLLLGAFAILLFQRIHRYQESIIFAGTLVFGFLLNTFLKFAFHRMRPEVFPLISMDSFSYPSGHAMNAFIFYGLLAYYLIVFTKRELLEITIAVSAISMIALIGISRVYLGVHYPTDVVAGYVAGLWVVMAAVYSYRHRRTVLFK